LRFCLGVGLIGSRRGKETDYLLAHLGQINTKAHEYLDTDAFTLPQKAQKNVLSTDVVVTELQSLP
jgi:hypothetical protein